MLSDSTFQQGIKRLESAFLVGKPLSKEALHEYFQAVKNFMPETWWNVINSVVMNETAFPKVATIFSHRKQIKTERKAIEKKPCDMCFQMTNKARGECGFPVDSLYYKTMILTGRDPEVKHAIELYGTRNWKGDRMRGWVKEHLIELPEIEGFEDHNGFKRIQPIMEHLAWRKSKGLDTGPYYEEILKEKA